MKRPVSPPVPRWQRRKQARPGELIAAALQVFVEKGYAATRLEDVALRAGISKGTIYLYFSNKEELFKAVVRQAVVPSIQAAEILQSEHHGSSAELLAKILRYWRQQTAATPLGAIPKLVIAECGNFPDLARFYFKEVIQRGHRIIAQTLRRGIKSGEFRPMAPNYALRVVIAPMIFSLLWKHSLEMCESRPLSADKFLDVHLDILLNGLVARKEPEPACSSRKLRK